MTLSTFSRQQGEAVVSLGGDKTEAACGRRLETTHTAGVEAAVAGLPTRMSPYRLAHGVVCSSVTPYARDCTEFEVDLIFILP